MTYFKYFVLNFYNGLSFIYFNNLRGYIYDDPFLKKSVRWPLMLLNLCYIFHIMSGFSVPTNIGVSVIFSLVAVFFICDITNSVALMCYHTGYILVVKLYIC